MNPFSDDSVVFASLVRDIDSQYAETESIFETAGLASFDGEMLQEMRPKKDENGIFYLESLHSHVFPVDVHLLDQIIWQCITSHELQNYHGMYQV